MEMRAERECYWLRALRSQSRNCRSKGEGKKGRKETAERRAPPANSLDDRAVKQLGRVNHGTCAVLKLLRPTVRSDANAHASSEVLRAEYFTRDRWSY